ncbi:MAG: hypothetical protein AB1646_12960 [Thermodesulfobacteriota bacterium]
MKEVKVFLNHFYFSLIVVLVGMIVLYILWSIYGGAIEMAGSGASGKGFTVGDNLLVVALVWVLLAAVLAGVLTVQTIRNRPKNEIVFTKRQH